MDDGISQVGTDIRRLKRELEERLGELDGKINIMAAMGEHTLRLLESLVHFSNGHIPLRPNELNHLGPSYTIEPFHPEEEYEEDLSHQPSAQRQPTFDERLAEVAERVNLSLDLARRIAEACPSKDPKVGDLGPSFGLCTYIQLQAIIDLVDNRRSSGGGGGSNRGERAGGKGGGDRSDPKKRARTDRPHPGCDGLKNGKCNANWVGNHYENHTPGCDYAPGGSRHKPYQGGGGSRGPR